MTLKSDSHGKKFIQTFGDLYRNNVLTDVTIVCDDRYRIEAHRMVLCAGSPLLRDFITMNAQSHPLIYLKGVKGQSLSTIMQFLYTGEVSINQEELPSLLEVAKELEIVELQEREIQKPNVFKEEENSSAPSVNTQSFSEKKRTKLKSQNIMDRPFKCGDCEYKGKSQKQLLEHVEMLHTLDDYETNVLPYQDMLDVIDVLETTNQEPMNGLQQLNTEEKDTSKGRFLKDLETTMQKRSIKLYESEVHKEYVQTSIKNVENGKLKSKSRSECIHCGRVYNDTQASHLKGHLKTKHPEVFAAVQAADDQKKKLKMEEIEKDDGLKNELALVQSQIQRARTQSAGNATLTELFFREAELKSRMLV